MSYEKVNPILEGLKIDEAGIRDIKETGKILSDINAKLKETNNIKLLQDILKYVTNEVDKDTSGTFTVANETFHLPLQRGEGGKLCDCIDEVVRQKIIKRLRSLVQKKFKVMKRQKIKFNINDSIHKIGSKEIWTVEKYTDNGYLIRNMFIVNELYIEDQKYYRKVKE